HLQKEDVRWDYMRTTDDPVRAILGLGAISDLIVMSAASDGHAGSDPALLGRILVASQTPVMIAPAKHQVFEPSRPALVAWDGSYEAANALRGAMPFLRLASSVTLLTINEHSGREMPPLDAAEYLARHGVASEVASLNVRDKSITQVIQQESADMGAGVVVMGAYGQSRVREYWFGGVTREMLEYVDIPLLMAH
ncbi:MAG: universal stress protein, partial [Alphaproteobacteria bacterium]|nr:universal stress protein [Alphaproteobacteria bacterium]